MLTTLSPLRGDGERRPLAGGFGRRARLDGAWAAGLTLPRNHQWLMKHSQIIVSLVWLVAGAVALQAQAVGAARRPGLPEGAIVHRDLAYIPGGHERHKLDLYLPGEGTNLPLIIYIHGGAWKAGSKQQGVPLEYLARGFAVASINYRLSQHATFPAQLQDCKAAVRWLRAHARQYRLDPQRFAAWGPSAGGHLAALLGTTGDVKEFDVGPHLEQSSRLQAVVDYFGPTDFLQMDGQRLPGGMVHGAADSPESELLGGPLQENQDKVAQANPITYVTPDDPPFLIVHGDRDPLVPHHQSVLLETALKKAGVPVTFYTVQGGGHGGFKDPQVPALTRAFLERHLKPARTLRAAAAGLFVMGVGVHDRIAERPQDWPLLTTQFASVTPENCLKPAAVQPAEGRFNFSQADAFVDFAVSNGLQVVGHCLVWAKDDRTPAWFFRDGTNLASGDLVLARMQTHIETVVGRYKGRIAQWDVVNEALDDGTNFLRPSGWTAACGEEFIARAFEFAHAADPRALLIYNDYNNELPRKREKLIRLVRSLREKKVPVHAVGLQGHYELDRLPLADLEATLGAMRELGVKVVISELDIDVIPRSRWWADGGKYRQELAKLDPYRDGCPPDILQRQADQYGQLFSLFRRYADVIVRVSFWNLHDGQSWLNNFPWRRVNHPLLFDRQAQPKPAFEAVLRALQAGPADPP